VGGSGLGVTPALANIVVGDGIASIVVGDGIASIVVGEGIASIVVGDGKTSLTGSGVGDLIPSLASAREIAFSPGDRGRGVGGPALAPPAGALGATAITGADTVGKGAGAKMIGVGGATGTTTLGEDTPARVLLAETAWLGAPKETSAAAVRNEPLHWRSSHIVLSMPPPRPSGTDTPASLPQVTMRLWHSSLSHSLSSSAIFKGPQEDSRVRKNPLNMSSQANTCRFDDSLLPPRIIPPVPNTSEKWNNHRIIIAAATIPNAQGLFISIRVGGVRIGVAWRQLIQVRCKVNPSRLKIMVQTCGAQGADRLQRR